MGPDALLRDMVTIMQNRIGAAALVLAMVWSAPASAQVDLSGNWVARQHEDWEERGPGPEAVDYLGLPINDEARARALAYSTSQLSLPERQCLYYAPHYVLIGPFGLKMWSESDPIAGQVIAWKIGAVIDRSIVTIWMDGRPHPPDDALHPFAGFTTGRWVGNTLVTTTTHFKEGYLRRNGVPTSDESTFEMYFSRHGDLLTVTAFIDDPVYLTESFVVSRTWQLDNSANLLPVPAPCVPEAELPGLQGDGDVPHYLPGRNPFVNEMTRMYNLPLEAVMGGAETMYPEFRRRLTDTYTPPDRCTRYCCGWGGAQGRTAPNLECLTGGSGTINER
ncbi:MAG: hypothetical protein HY657_17645 [Acidobacteria bacterium]|nr:hypothetical protein [Acidobacteriota bacterium]